MDKTNQPRTTIASVTGPIPVEDLGITMMHEHVYVTFPGTELDDAYRFDRADFMARAVERFQLLASHRVRTFVDPAPIELGRDVSIMRELSEKTGIRIIAATGFYTERVGIPGYWRIRSADEIAELFVRELVSGIGSTSIRAGVIKCATSGPQISDLEQKVLRAVAIAHRQTLAPIITHNESDVGAVEQQALLRSYGIEPHRCLIGHCSNSADPEYHMAVVEGGSYIGFDRIGMPHRGSDDVHADNIARLFRAGFGHRVIISQDRFVEFGGKPYKPLSPSELAQVGAFDHLFTSFVPQLLAAGLTQDDVEQMLIRNPKSFFRGTAQGDTHV